MRRLDGVSRLPGRAHQITLLEPDTDRALRMVLPVAAARLRFEG